MQYHLDKPVEVLRHIGDGKFEAILTDGSIDEVNGGVSGLVKFIYFENEPLPPIGWTVTREKTSKDYHDKIDRIKKK